MSKTIRYGVGSLCPGAGLERVAQENSGVAVSVCSGLQPSLGKGYQESVLRKRNVYDPSKYEKMLNLIQ